MLVSFTPQGVSMHPINFLTVFFLFIQEPIGMRLMVHCMQSRQTRSEVSCLSTFLPLKCAFDIAKEKGACRLNIHLVTSHTVIPFSASSMASCSAHGQYFLPIFLASPDSPTELVFKAATMDVHDIGMVDSAFPFSQ